MMAFILFNFVKHTFYLKVCIGDVSVIYEVVKQVLTLPLNSDMKLEFVKRVIDECCIASLQKKTEIAGDNLNV